MLPSHGSGGAASHATPPGGGGGSGSQQNNSGSCFPGLKPFPMDHIPPVVPQSTGTPNALAATPSDLTSTNPLMAIWKKEQEQQGHCQFGGGGAAVVVDPPNSNLLHQSSQLMFGAPHNPMVFHQPPPTNIIMNTMPLLQQQFPPPPPAADGGCPTATTPGLLHPNNAAQLHNNEINPNNTNLQQQLGSDGTIINNLAG
ncbi:unnamed protein product, partial [Amoebophrya sp. A120]|eukprot:GSA120T00014177001.1